MRNSVTQVTTENSFAILTNRRALARWEAADFSYETPDCIIAPPSFVLPRVLDSSVEQTNGHGGRWPFTIRYRRIKRPVRFAFRRFRGKDTSRGIAIPSIISDDARSRRLRLSHSGKFWCLLVNVAYGICSSHFSDICRGIEVPLSIFGKRCEWEL